MTQNINDLIEKINQEGIEKAQINADQIELKAKKAAEEIISNAKLKADKILEEAKETISKYQEREKQLIVQAARDMLLTLRKEINAMLDKIIVAEIDKALFPDALEKIITSIIKQNNIDDSREVVLDLSKKDFLVVEKTFLSKLKIETKKGILFRAQDNIKGGFVISFDANKSHYDFSDKALAEYIGLYLKPKLNEILKEATN